MSRTNEPGRTVSSKLLDILFCFEPDHQQLGLADIVRRTGMPYATVRRLVLELVEAGALDRDRNGRFTVGLRLWQLGTLAPRTESLRTLAQPFMEDLYAALRQHVQLAVLDGKEGVIIERLSGPSAPGVVGRVGGRIPLHASAVGKVLLAHGGSELTEQILSRKLRKYTARTPVDPAELRRQLAACRRSGTATVRGELTSDIDSIATRIMDGEGRVVAAISIVVRSGSVSMQSALPTLVSSGLGISRLLGWRPTVPVRDAS